MAYSIKGSSVLPVPLQLHAYRPGLCYVSSYQAYCEKYKAARDWSRLLSIFTDELKSTFLL